VVVRELTPEQTLEVLQARKDRLERHHNVAIADEALLASVVLTDRFITDRARPDRAIDALDEACAHTQASAVYSQATEALVVERRELLRHVERADAAAPEAERTPPAEEEEDPIERFAREGLAALERFGAEIEAAFSGQRGSAPPSTRRATDARTSSPPSQMPPRGERSAKARLAAVELELQRRLVEEGLVVRGHDVARVVSAATGLNVQWSA
jgi:ATP-dependent Clp protease ATP-binding subunit ClpA